MGAFFGFIFGLWFVVGMVVAIYFWFTKTDRSQAPLERRLIALGWGLGWPYHAVKFFMNRDQADKARADQSAAAARILGGNNGNGAPASRPSAAPSVGSTMPKPASQSGIQNPFDV